ncbi:MAG: PHA/PHB synthase family protein, partial [Gammaproteobacteria bacterium]
MSSNNREQVDGQSEQGRNLDPQRLANVMLGVARECQSFLQSYLATQAARRDADIDPLGVIPAMQALAQSWLRNPSALMQAQWDAWRQTLSVWQHFNQRLWGLDPGPVVVPPPGDRRFRDVEWQANPLFDFIKQTYLVAANALIKSVETSSGLEPKVARKAQFYVRQFADSLSPTNFVATNPEVLRATLETGGKNLLDGLRHLIEDFDPRDGRVRPRMVDGSAFVLGKNIASAPGKVVFQNTLMQLIQYAPTTAQVHRQPLLITPPWINKFYVLDLQPKNSFIRWAVAQGHTVFVISWVNPDESLRDKDFEDYIFEGPLAALEVIEKATGERSLNMIGYCIGGTLLGAALAYLRARGDTRVASATFFTSLLDFSEVGDIGVFIDEAQIENLETSMNARGYLDGREMASAFNMIRANDLIWSFIVNNYLLGREPASFDLLYWNADSTRMPARMHSTY